MSDQCVFCKIVNKEIPSDILFEDGQLIVIRDINPQTPTHLLIVPKEHITGLDGLLPGHVQLMGHIMVSSKKIAKQAGLADSGWRLAINCGGDAKQTVSHLHIHLLGGRPMTGQMA
ncbi:MAG: histidine triad nucleotide-binding protein [Holophagaceae bacterium]|nr:histidine triad nucleotide-binding protein [Holophagaceae bacterium]